MKTENPSVNAAGRGLLAAFFTFLAAVPVQAGEDPLPPVADAIALTNVFDEPGYGFAFHYPENWVAKAADGVYTVDIEPRVYESGSGYVWRKRPGVRFKPQDVDVTLIDDDPSKFEQYAEDY